MITGIKNIITRFCRLIIFAPAVACFIPAAVSAQITPVKTAPIAEGRMAPVAGASDAVRTRIRPAAPQPLPQIRSNTNQVASLSFAWNIPVGLAVFKRGPYLWIVFDHNQSVNLDELAQTAAPLAEEVIQIPNFQGLILRLRLKNDINYAIRKEGLLWIVDLFTQDIPVRIKDMQIFTQYNSKKQPYLYVPVSGTGNIVSTLDPEVGDTLIIAPNMDIGIGISKPYSYPDLDILSSIQGLALISKTNDIVVNRATSGLTVQGYNRGLNISEDLEMLKRQELLLQSEIDFASFSSGIPADIQNAPFIEGEQKLRQDIQKAPEEQKNKARMELARYYLSKGLGTNALGILNKIKASDAPEARSDLLHGMLGVANFLANRYEEAIENFSYGKLPAVNEALFWKTLSSAALEYQDEHSAILLSFISLIRDYPDEIKDRIALVGAAIALKAGDDLSTQNFIDILKNSKHPERLVPAVHYFSAQKLVLQGSPMSAVSEYKRILPLESLKYTSFARKEIVDLSLKLNIMPLDRAIAEYEKLRYAWGEKYFKIGLLKGLADLYAQKKDFYNSLRTLNELKNLSDYEDKAGVERQMVNLFENIYINNEADYLPALKSLALYQDFEWLAPKSPRYNTIIQKLSDRLVAVDLLDRAETLLQDQLKNNEMTALDRSKTGARLALIYLFNKKDEEALLMLDKTEMPQMPQTLFLHRKIIRAKALSNMGREDEALELLKDDFSKNAILLKSEIYWNAELWGPASDTIKYLIEKPVAGKPLSDEQMNYILDWATALKKSGKETVIVRLRNKFMPYFQNTKYYSVFNILTNSLRDDKIDINDINRVVNDISAFSNFTKIYTNSLKSGDLDKDTD